MNTSSEHFLTPAAPTAATGFFGFQERKVVRVLASRFWWVGVAMIAFGVIAALAPFLDHWNAATVIGGLVQGGLTVLLGEMTRRVGVAFQALDGGLGRAPEDLWPPLHRLLGLYNVYFFLMLIAVVLFSLLILFIIGMLLFR
jgi:hypothetical protein